MPPRLPAASNVINADRTLALVACIPRHIESTLIVAIEIIDASNLVESRSCNALHVLRNNHASLAVSLAHIALVAGVIGPPSVVQPQGSKIGQVLIFLALHIPFHNVLCGE